MQQTFLAFLLVLFAACGTTKEASRGGEEKGDLRKYEEGFRPSDYDPRAQQALRDTLTAMRTQPDSSMVPAPATLEVVPGFRVQAFASSNIDEANARKADLETQFPAEWFYLEYDQPTYKIRGGNFLNRLGAERFARQLEDSGFAGAWVVPERVFKNPPPPPERIPPPESPK